MASKKGISYQWQIFLPVLLTFWIVIISMALWQTYRVGEVKRAFVNDQLSLVGERIAEHYNTHDEATAASFMNFINEFYRELKGYDPMNIQVQNPDGTLVANIGNVLDNNLPIVNSDETSGIMTLPGASLEDNDDDMQYLYYVTRADDGKKIYVMLPYTKIVAEKLSASTTKFWLIFFSVAIFVTIFSYISSQFFSQNVRILRDFANKAAMDPDFVSHSADEFPHDELGEISRQIVNIYNQRQHEFEQREKEHKVALNAIKEKDRIKRELTGNINHELKTPVGVIQGYIDTIIENPDMDEETRNRFLMKTHQNVHRLTSLINDITVITKVENGGKLVNLSELDFHDLVYTFASYLDEAGVLNGKMAFTFDIPINCKVLGNEALLNSVLLNLVKNSVAYSGGDLCHIELAEEDADFCYFRYYDDGVGVPPESLPHIFERFYRVNSGRSRETGGTGLGLAIIEVTIESFGGKITASNRQPQGLEFMFSLPKHKRNKANKNQSHKKDHEQEADLMNQTVA